MVKRNFFGILAGCLLGIVILVCLWKTVLQVHVNAYGIRTTQELLGNQPLALENEQKILAIAQEMGITEPLIIRKMNSTALQAFGYYNAFIMFPKACAIIPLGSQAFFYASEGFFEALSPEEQRFLIGHELVHARERHLLYSPLIFTVIELFSWALALFLAWCLFRRSGKKYYAYLLALVLVIVFELCIGLMMNGYRRCIEREADAVSLNLLQSHDGGLKLLDRWLRGHSMPLHNAYGGWLADHPSVHERKMCFLECKNKQRDL